MLSSVHSRNRSGVTAAELLVALTIAGIVLALLTGIAVREQRVFSDLADASALEAHLREAASVLPIDLRDLAPASNDIRQATDTALEIRATIASAVVCDTTATALVLAPATSSARFASFATPIAVGDTAWLLSASDTSDTWLPLAISASGTAPAGNCGALGPSLDPTEIATARTTISADHAAAGSGPLVGLPIRVTRPIRYSLYHVSDGLWYLGERDWNATTLRFNTIQPVAGPFLSATLGGLTFSYLDRTGTAIASPVADRTSIASVRIDLRGETDRITRAFGSKSTDAPSRRRDSVTVVVSTRGSPSP